MTTRAIKYVAVAAAVVGLSGVFSVAWAYFATTGSGSASASVATLAAPTDVDAEAGGAVVTVTWADITAPDGGVADGYLVERTADGTTFAAACGSSVTTPVTAGDETCADSGVDDGTYRYRVTALWRSWTAVGDLSDEVTVVNDADAPNATVEFPAGSGSYDETSFLAGCGTPGGDICGTADDDDGSVTLVRVSVQRLADDRFWDGTDFAATAETFHPATLTPTSGPAVDWHLALPLPASGSYTIAVQAADAAGNEQTGTDYAAAATFTVDLDPPTVTVEQASGDQDDPTNQQPLRFAVLFSEPVTGFDETGVNLTGSGAGAATAAVTGSGAAYEIAVSGVTDGTVTSAVAADAASDLAGNGNEASTSTDNTITFDGTAPTVAVAVADTQDDPTNDSPVHFTVTVDEPVDGFDGDAVTLAGTAGATTAAVTGAGPTYDVAVSGMTADGTVVVSVAAGAVSDPAGNPNTASGTASVLYDTTAPVTSDDAASTWTNQSVTVTLSPTDGGSGVAATHHTTNGDTPTAASPTGTSVVLTGEGLHTVKYRSIDLAGNLEAVRTADVVRIDKTAPTITAAATNAGGTYSPGTWSGSAVTVAFTCGDTGGSGVVSCPDPQGFTASGTYSAIGNVADQAGNAASVTVNSIMVDVTAPTGSVTSPAPGAVGGVVTLAAGDAYDAHSGLGSVQFQAKPAAGTFANIGSSWDTTTLANGGYVLRAVITDAVGNAHTTGEVAVTVSNTFTVSAPGTATAGGAFNVTIRAYAGGVTDTGFTGVKTITFTGPASSPSDATPTYPASVAFTNGVGTASVTLVKAETTTITATATTTHTGTSGNVVVAAGAAKGLAFTNTSNGAGAVSISCTGSVADRSCETDTAHSGNNRKFTGNVALVDQYLNPATNTSGTAISVAMTSSPANNVTPTSLSIVNNAGTSGGQFTLALPTGNAARTVTATATVGGSTVKISCLAD